jgi:hypothetical protein
MYVDFYLDLECVYYAEAASDHDTYLELAGFSVYIWSILGLFLNQVRPDDSKQVQK